MRIRLLRTLAAAAALATATAHAVVPLPQYNVDTSKATVSGLSSGAFMANQMGYAYSGLLQGHRQGRRRPWRLQPQQLHGLHVQRHDQLGARCRRCRATSTPGAARQIDAKANVAGQKIYMFVGSSDTTVGPNPMAAAQTQYTNNGVTAANLQFVQRASTGHTFPTDFDATGNNTCSTTASPYISNCGYDGAKAVLSAFYGTLNARNNAPAASNYIEFNQAAFTSNPGMAATGWVYVPANCAAGAQCRLHVALHGCLQGYATIGDKFVKNTGYTRWADTNSIIVLFPQARVDRHAAT